MKKSTLTKIVAVAAAATMSLGFTNVFAETVNPASIGESGPIQPYNVIISTTYNNLTLGSLGKMTCEGYTTVPGGYKSGVVVELQQYDGGWGTIKTWSASGNTSAVISEDWYVEKGYSYRLKLTHKGYDSNGSLLESFNKYSKVVDYN